MTVKKMWILLAVVVIVFGVVLGLTISNKNVLQAEKTALENVKTDLNTQLDAAKKDVETVKADLGAQLEAAQKDAEAVKADLGAQLEAAKKDAETAQTDLGTQFDTVKKDAEAVQADLGAQLEAVKADLGAQLETVKKDAEAVKADLSAKLEAAQKDVEAVKADLGAQLETAKKDAEAVKADLGAKLEAAQKEVETVKADLGAQLEAAKTELSAALMLSATPEPTAEPTPEPTPEATPEVTPDPAVIALAEAKASGKTIVTLWHSFTKGQQDTMNALVAEYNAKNANVYVNAEYQSSRGLESKTMNAVLAGEGPDMLFHYASEAANYIDADNPENNLVVNLAPYFEDAEIGLPDYKDMMEASVYGEATGFADGGMYILPMVRTGPILYYNKTIFAELGLSVPTTWEELAETAKTIKEKKGVYGFAADSLTEIMQSLIMQKGSEYIDVATKTAKIDNQITIDAATWYGDNVKSGVFMAAPTTDYYSNDINNQIVAMYIGSCAGIPYLFPADNGWELGVAATPTWKETTTPWYPAWNRGFMLFKSNEDTQRAAYDFLKYFSSAEANLRWCESVICLSPYKATQALPGYQTLIDANPALQALGECLPTAGFLPSIKGASTVRDELKAIAQMAGDESNTTSIADMVAQAEMTCNESLQGN